MKWDEISTQCCSVAKATSIFGDKWTLMILRQMFMGMRKFSEIQQSLEITKHRLTDRLNRLIEQGIIFKHLYDDKYNRFEYRLTEKGVDLYAVFITIGQWGDKWEADGDGPPVQYVHKECGQVADPVLSCSCCGGKLTPKNIAVQIGPGVTNKLEREEITENELKLYSGVMAKESG